MHLCPERACFTVVVLLSAQERAQALAVLEEVEYVELSGREDFQDIFVDLLGFPQ